MIVEFTIPNLISRDMITSVIQIHCDYPIPIRSGIGLIAGERPGAGSNHISASQISSCIVQASIIVV